MEKLRKLEKKENLHFNISAEPGNIKLLVIVLLLPFSYI